MRPDFDEIRTLTKRFVLIPQKVAKFVFGVFRYADLSVLGHLGDANVGRRRLDSHFENPLPKTVRSYGNSFVR